MFADAHLHMTNPEFGEGYEGIGDAVILFSNAVLPKEFGRLHALAERDQRVVPFYGTHPWYLESYNAEDLIRELDSNPKANVGEIGLDARYGSLEPQLPIFREQLKIAEDYNRTVSLHMVSTEEYILRELRRVKVNAILHSFNGPAGYVNTFEKCGCYFSVSPRIFRRPQDKVMDILTKIPVDRLLIETDAPTDLLNDMSVYALAENIGRAIGMSREKVLDVTLENARRLIG